MRFKLNPTEPLTAQCRAAGLYQRGLISGVRVYRFYDDADQLLYIGVTCCFPERWQAHKKRADWWPLVGSVCVSLPYPHMAAALAVERAAIHAERPAYNRRSSLIVHGGVNE